jgi:RNA polymerase sigma-70 factor, ECF subfamily
MNQEQAQRLVDELFVSWGPFLARYVLRITQCPELADDLVQEAFLALYRDIRADKYINNPRAWTFGAVRNQIRKHVRHSVRHAEDLVGADALDQLAAEPRWPDVDAGSEEIRSVPLSALTAREEEVVLLRLQSFKYREIAVQLGISAKSVATLLARALRKLHAASQSVSSGRPEKRKREGYRALQ